MGIITKDDNTQKVFLSEDTIDVVEILEEHYDYIYESMQKENFILKYDECNLFKELVYDNKVVGFCSYDFSRDFITAAINNIYVLPEYRGKKILLAEIEKTMTEHNKPSIMEPTRLIVELLIQYGFAKKINDNIVASALEFVIPGDHVLSNGEYDNEELSTHFYDLNICSSIHILDLANSHVAYSAPLNYDILHYDCLEARDNIDEEYFKNITLLFDENDFVFMNTLVDLENNLPIKEYTLDEVIGDDDSFSFYIESLIDDAHVTRSKALEIKQQIREEYEAGMILNESLLIRLAYLFDENPTPKATSHDDVCPYCEMPIDSHDRYCHFCGINLSYNPDEMEDNLIKSLNTNGSDLDEDIRYVAYKFLNLVDEGIDITYSLFTVCNNYNVSEFELTSFLDDNNYFNDNGITGEGYDFLNNHPLHFWKKYQMDIVNYSDFENYFYNHMGANPLEVCLGYLKQFNDDDYISEIINDINKDLR